MLDLRLFSAYNYALLPPFWRMMNEAVEDHGREKLWGLEGTG